METLVIILNYRSTELTLDCLRSLESEAAAGGIAVAVVEGASGDDSARRLAEAVEQNGWSTWASVTALVENRGYAAGNNTAIRAAMQRTDRPRHILILNPDTVVRPGAVRALADFIDRNPRVGIATSQLENADGTLQSCAFRFPSCISEFETGLRSGPASRLLEPWRVGLPHRDTAHRADWVSGASFMVRTAMLRDVGLMDEGYFLYFDEVDYCRRAVRAGWECWLVPASRVVHLIGQSTGVSAQNERRVKRRPAYWYNSRRRYFVKHHGVVGLLLADALWAAGRAALLLRMALGLGGDIRMEPQRMARDLLLGDMRAILTGKAFGVMEVGTQ